MIKKHLFTCSVILVLVVISGLGICSSHERNTANISRHTTRFILINKAPQSYNFADENLPVNRVAVTRKLNHLLAQHNFKTVQSNVLQYKAEKLFPVIEPILQLYGIPDDFKYIPLVESGLCSGTSPRGANGIWQFMPGTARTYGLKVGHGRDERLNVTKSTIAACKYIKGLYAEFNNWTLTAAAYNNGSVKLHRAMRQQNENDYYRMHLNRETGNYIYRLVAMKEIIGQPKKYGYDNFYSYVQTSQMLAYN